MIKTILLSEDKKPLWIDITAPTEAELSDIAKQYDLHSTSVHDCLDSMHLPKFEKLGSTTFIIARLFDENSSKNDHTLQSMTRKIAIFLGDRFLITVHRTEVPFLPELAETYSKTDPAKIFLQQLTVEILTQAIETYLKPLEEMEMRIEEFEFSLLKGKERFKGWPELLGIKSRLMVIKRMLWHTMNSIQKFIPNTSTYSPIMQDLKEHIDSLQFFTDSLADDLDSLLEIQISISSHRMMESSNRTNETMRFLTLFSIFFMPINFIVGVYGMNFEHMPELKWKYGYFIVWGLIVSVEVGLYLWFKRLGWMKSQEKI